MENNKPFELKYCSKCLQNNLRPHIHFHEDGVCAPCRNVEDRKKIDWNDRWNQLEKICDKYRGKYGNGYDCAIAISGGKDSHHQVKLFVEDLGMNPLLISIGNLEWTETGRKNLANISEVFNRDILIHQPNSNLTRRLTKIAFEELGSPTWYLDSLIYAVPWAQTIKQGLHLLVYGENVSHLWGGKDAEETPYAYKQSENNVVKPEWDRFLKHGITEKELFSAKMLTGDEGKQHGLEPIYLSYFIPWSSQLNAEVAKRWGFQDLSGEYKQQNTLEDFNQIDSLSYKLNQILKAMKFASSSATDFANRWIRDGLKTREEMIPIVTEKDLILDQRVAELFMKFVGMNAKEFYGIIDKWYNRDIFYQDRWGVWRPKFDVGVGMKPEWK